MNSAFQARRTLCQGISDAFVEACVLEATAPKAGNVYPGKEFNDLKYSDFMSAAQISGDALDDATGSFSQWILAATGRIANELKTNVNLGILLLVGPLIDAEQANPESKGTAKEWSEASSRIVEDLSPEDSQRLYDSINAASPGGMGDAEKHDLSESAPASFLSAMHLARQRDRIAADYCNGFSHLFDDVAPILRHHLENNENVLAAIASTHLDLLTRFPDTLIARKFGDRVANDVQQLVPQDHSDLKAIQEFDRYLRSGTIDLQGHHRTINPGTTADFIAAGIYVLLRLEDLASLRPAPPSITQP